LFQTSQTGLLNEYGKIEETISPQVLETIADWILKRTNVKENREISSTKILKN
jgi:hypothetical protein